MSQIPQVYRFHNDEVVAIESAVSRIEGVENKTHLMRLALEAYLQAHGLVYPMPAIKQGRRIDLAKSNNGKEV